MSTVDEAAGELHTPAPIRIRRRCPGRLLKKTRESVDGDINDEEERLLRRKERELERLDRELEQQRAAGRQLDRLDRELSQAAEDLMRDLGTNAQDAGLRNLRVDVEGNLGSVEVGGEWDQSGQPACGCGEPALLRASLPRRGPAGRALRWPSVRSGDSRKLLRSDEDTGSF